MKRVSIILILVSFMLAICSGVSAGPPGVSSLKLEKKISIKKNVTAVNFVDQTTVVKEAICDVGMPCISNKRYDQHNNAEFQVYNFCIQAPVIVFSNIRRYVQPSLIDRSQHHNKPPNNLQLLL